MGGPIADTEHARERVASERRVRADATELGDALADLTALTAILRRECPWDRAQSPATIAPHTVEEAYEVADVMRSLDDTPDGDARAVDELGDLLFQVVILAQLVGERHAGVTVAAAARSIHDKLVRRHPHVFGEQVVATTPNEVRAAWDEVKASQEGSHRGQGLAGRLDVPATHGSLLHARKVQQRAAGMGFDFAGPREAFDKLAEEIAELQTALADAGSGAPTAQEGDEPPRQLRHELGDVLFAATNVARLVRADPDLELRDATERFRARVAGAIALAADDGHSFDQLDLQLQERYYQQAKRNLTGS